MTLAPGTRFGPYEVLSPLGAGGMGEVYRAKDTRLGREVALKILPSELAADAERLARFEREAKVLASLNHPHIAVLFGIERIDGQLALAMELVEGEGLDERIAHGSVPIDEAVPIATQIAEALEAAHEKGVVHRDLKPANVKVRPDGTVKVLDFGLAKAWEEPAAPGDLAYSPTITGHHTRAGVILGTAAYMSPEQARGKAVDKRADIWAFGVVLFEMLAGGKPFEGETLTDLTAAIVTRDPEWGRLPASVSPHVRRVVKRCLEKDLKLRLHDIADARIELATRDEAAAPPAPATRPGSRVTRWLAPVAAVAVAAMAFAAWRLLRPTPEATWSGVRLGGPEIAMTPRVSPDGGTLAFLAMVDNNTQVAVMKPESGNWRVLTHKADAGYVNEVAWSADGDRLYYDRGADVPMGVFTVPVLGGEERLVLEDAREPAPLPDGSLLVLRLNAEHVLQLSRFWPESGRLQPFPLVSESNGYTWLRTFPDAREAVFLARLVGAQDTGVHPYAIELDSGAVRRIETGLPDGSITALAAGPDNRSLLLAVALGDATRVVAVPRRGGRPSRPLLTLTQRVYGLDASRDGSVLVNPWEFRSVVAHFPFRGGPARKVARLPGGVMGAFGITALADGRIVAQQLAGGRPRLVALEPGKDPVPVVNTSEATAAPATTVGAGELAFLIGGAPHRTIAVASLASGRVTRRISLANGPITSLSASPDGKTLFCSAAGSIWAIPEAGEPRKICAGDSAAAEPDGRGLLVQVIELPKTHLLRVPLDGGTAHEVPLNGPFHLTFDPLSSAQVSRDGRLLVPLASLDNWFFCPGVVDVATGRMTRIETDFVGDFHSMAWLPDGRVAGSANEIQAEIWKFTPEKR